MKEPLEDFNYANEPAYTGISKAAAKDLAKRFVSESQALLNSKLPDSTNKSDARSIVFSIETLKKYIWEIENNVRNIHNQKELGVRIYFGKYPNIAEIRQNPQHPLHKDFANLPESYSALHTAFLVPTFKDDHGKDVDFDPWQSNVEDRMIPIDPNTNEVTQSGTMTALLNHGNLCPPPFPVNGQSNLRDGLSF